HHITYSDEVKSHTPVIESLLQIQVSNKCSAQDLVLQCEECENYSVCTCRLCDAVFCRLHFGSHMDAKHKHCKTKPDSSTCKKHSLQFKHYCRSCVKPICNDCMRYEDHSTHGLSSPVAMMEYFRESIFNENEELKNIIKPFYNTLLDFIVKKQSEMPRSYTKARENINEFGRKMHEQVNCAVKHYIEILEVNAKEQLGNIKDYLKFFQQRIDDIEKTLEENSQLLQKSDSFDLLTSFESSLAYFHTYPDLSEFKMPVFHPNIPDSKTIMNLAGNIDYPTGTDVPLSLNYKQVQLSQSHLLKRPSVLQKSVGSNLDILDLSCLQSDGVLTIGKGKQLKRFQFTSRELFHVQTNELECKSRYMAISPKCSIYFSDRKNRSVKKYGSLYCHQLTTVLDFDDLEPRGLTFTPSSQLLVCLYSKKRSFIARFVNDNKLVQEIEYNGDKQLYKEPCFVCCNRNGDVCVADHGLHCVIVVDQFGVFRFSYGDQNKTSFQPYSIATDHLCNIVITDNFNHEIHLLDKYGQFLGLLMSKHPIIRPGAVAIDEKGKLWIGHSSGGDLAVIKYLK
ncbi:uncharacterized protein LOC128155558, partial [Crassostrea angulata]|uniref:uncharacterized protein LOC128155558 n=1 Tax=Magallana angulata TaxID=2784310 RepID=UPI0022B10742